MASPITGATRLAAIIGSPVRHSLSPAIHNAAFEASGHDWRFVAFEVADGGGPGAIDAMRRLGIAGLCVTMPHKSDVAAVVDELDPAARALQSVNTVVLRDDGSTYGTSTDGAGFVDSVEAMDVDLTGRRVVVIGAGAAARSIVDAMGRAAIADLVVVNRTAAAAEAAAELAGLARVGTVDELADADLVVNTTSLGMAGTATANDVPVPVDLLRADLVVADIVYHPLETPLLAAARAVGARTVDGLGMLVHQAGRQQEHWTGVRPDPAVLRAAAERELANRSAT